MAKQRIYLGIEAKKKSKNGLTVECAKLNAASSRKEAAAMFAEYADMNPCMVLTEKEAQLMLKKLSRLLNPLTDKEVRATLKKHRKSRDPRERSMASELMKWWKSCSQERNAGNS